MGKLNCLPPNCTINETNSYNDVWQRKNDPFDLELIRRVFMSVIEASEILGRDQSRRDTWRSTLRNLADLPANGPIIARFEGDRTKTHGFCVVDTMGPDLAGVYGPGERPVGRGPQSSMRLHPAPAPSASATVGWPRPSAHRGAPRAGGQGPSTVRWAATRFPSGIMGEGGVKPVPGYGRGTPQVLIGESGPAFCAAVNEMLLQSWPDGVIRVFPAVPAEWSDASYCRLVALGALAVSACRRGGQTRHVVIESGQGSPCSLALPAAWKRADLRVREMPANRVIDPKWDGEVALFTTARGTTYVVDRPSDAFETHVAPAFEAKPAAGPRKYTGLGPVVVHGDFRSK